MFDKIFKIAILLILGFVAYSLYLYVIHTRYYMSGRVLVDRQTGTIYRPEIVQQSRKTQIAYKYKQSPTSNTPTTPKDPVFKTKEELRAFLLADSTKSPGTKDD